MNSFSSQSRSYAPVENKMSQEESDKPLSSPGTKVYSHEQDDLIPEHSASFGGGPYVPIFLNKPDSIGSGQVPLIGQKELEDLKDIAKKRDNSSFNHADGSMKEKKGEKNLCNEDQNKKYQEYVEDVENKGDVSSFNHASAVMEEKKFKQNAYNEDEGKQSYMKRIEKLKSDAEQYAEKSEEEKAKHMSEFKGNFAQLHTIVGLSFKSQEDKGLATMLKSIELNLKDFLPIWGPKRCLMYLKLASVYSKLGDNQNFDMLRKAEEDLNGMNDNGDISECRRWLLLQRVESRMYSDVNKKELDKKELNKEGILLDKCWNVNQRHFEGRRDFLDFYTIFWAKHLVRLGEHKKAERAYCDALVLRKQRKIFWEQDDFDWDKIEKEVKEEIEENKKQMLKS